MTMNSVLGRVVGEVQKRWFLLGIVLVITLAHLQPFIGAKGGEWKYFVGKKYCYEVEIFISLGGGWMMMLVYKMGWE